MHERPSLGLKPSSQARFIESPGTYPDAEPYDVGMFEQAETIAARLISAPAATNTRYLLIHFSLPGAVCHCRPQCITSSGRCEGITDR
ncbi:hypothetical protein BN77_2580 [Rhizobium mesoamericanum STM3625]|uniref:Uncharacterized protein n=1 Tax=Rhizobium mesoamericanum STM3625 TaxID=1211777 RepID=K0PW23_9HYPH|nr:hypothetical protein BN77_2580 [Rhizobium mesoamericanum STM3625]